MPYHHLNAKAVSFHGLAIVLGALISTPTLSISAADSGPLLTGKAAMTDFSDDAPGVRRLITTNDLVAPDPASSAANFSRVIPRPAGAVPKVPPGFEVKLFAEGLNNPRKLITAPNGDIFLAESGAGRVKVFRTDKNGNVERTEIFASGLRQPFGIAFYPPGNKPTHVYIANTGSLVRYAYQDGDLQARGEPETIIPEIPQGGGHWTRDVVFSLDGKKMFVSVGSRSNVSDDAQEKNRANILEYNPDGTGFRVYASGIRNPVGLAIHPTTGELWTSVNERDALGDNLVPDYITHVQENGFYGWPWYYMGNHQDPRHAGKRPELASQVIVPDVLLQAHMASLCLTFYTNTAFPEQYRNVAFAAEHGSWNRSRRVGYKVIYIPMRNGRATGEFVDFMTGFVTEDGQVWGRPVGVTVDNSGALLVSDDGGNRIWRITYGGGSQASN